MHLRQPPAVGRVPGGWKGDLLRHLRLERLAGERDPKSQSVLAAATPPLHRRRAVLTQCEVLQNCCSGCAGFLPRLHLRALQLVGTGWSLRRQMLSFAICPRGERAAGLRTTALSRRNDLPLVSWPNRGSRVARGRSRDCSFRSAGESPHGNGRELDPCASPAQRRGCSLVDGGWRPWRAETRRSEKLLCHRLRRQLQAVAWSGFLAGCF